VGFLWPVHRVHHSDPDFDVSTAGRFHPIEPLLVGGADLAIILLLAPPPIAVFFAKLAGAFFNLWEHANASLPPHVDGILRRWMMTPTAHRIHHSQGIAEQNRNLGEILPWWDRIFGTYQAGDGGDLVVGLRGYQNCRSVELTEILKQPFRKERRIDEAKSALLSAAAQDQESTGN
jgi:sterol desaturase/sphingolipid hydroxylase (fatty acid hydroxylase superfamily)